ncbi:unnamed protein product, partial [Didymodactylos carnosus]
CRICNITVDFMIVTDNESNIFQLNFWDNNYNILDREAEYEIKQISIRTFRDEVTGTVGKESFMIRISGNEIVPFQMPEITSSSSSVDVGVTTATNSSNLISHRETTGSVGDMCKEN